MDELLFISGGEIFIILLFILIFFGSDKLPGLAKSLGKGLREIKRATDEIKEEIDKEVKNHTKEINTIKKDIEKNITPPTQETTDHSRSIND